MIVTLIAAVSENNVIGRDNTLIWRIPQDMKRFKEITWGHHVIMGRKSFESLQNPLSSRTNIILTRQRSYHPEGCAESKSAEDPDCFVVHSPEEALALSRMRRETEVFIAGGEQVYRRFLELADRIYLTRVHHTFEGDTFFPDLEGDWVETHREERPDEKPYAFSFVTYSRKHPRNP
ncbi:IS1595 family transposase ISSsu9 [subsurface metagenome]